MDVEMMKIRGGENHSQGGRAPLQGTVCACVSQAGTTVGFAFFFTSSTLLALASPVNVKSEQCFSHWKLCQEMVPGI